MEKKNDEKIPEIPADANSLNADWLKVMDFILNPNKDFKEREYLEKLASQLGEEGKRSIIELAEKYGLKERREKEMKIYYKLLRGDKYSMIPCEACLKMGVSYQIVEMHINGARYVEGVNMSGKGYYCSKDCIKKIYPDAEIRAERREKK